MWEISLVLAHDVQSYNNSETGLTLSLYRYHFISRETYLLIQLPPHPFLLIPIQSCHSQSSVLYRTMKLYLLNMSMSAF